MDLSRNTELLDRPLVAFFASRKATPHDAQLARQWAESICQTNKVVISGFHSPLEKEIMTFLLERQHPVVIALGRSLYNVSQSNYSLILTKVEYYLYCTGAIQGIAGTPHKLGTGRLQILPMKYILRNSMKRVR